METLEIKLGSKFKKDVEKLLKQNKNMSLLYKVLDILKNKLELDPKYKDHQLKGKLKGFRDLHIEPDWLLLYQVLDNKVLYLFRTGSHSDLFK